jgi:hypothetical protein
MRLDEYIALVKVLIKTLEGANYELLTPNIRTSSRMR